MTISALTIFFSFLSSLGIGASTVAVVNFFVAVWDGKIDEHERRMMGVTYTILRVILASLFLVSLMFTINTYTNAEPLSAFLVQIWTLIFILFINAIFMTFHKIPSAFGPAIQASAWYTLGLLSILHLVGSDVIYSQFLLLYITVCLFSVSAINSILVYCKHQQEARSN